MLALLQDLVRHKAHASEALLAAVARHGGAARDEEVRTLLHHILVANRFWWALIRGLPFDAETEGRVPPSLEPIAAHFRELHAQELRFVVGLGEADFHPRLESPFLPGQRFSVAEALMQVCLHSHGHRAQAATRLRLLGGTPPAMDFVLWLKERPR